MNDRTIYRVTPNEINKLNVVFMNDAQLKATKHNTFYRIKMNLLSLTFLYNQKSTQNTITYNTFSVIIPGSLFTTIKSKHAALNKLWILYNSNDKNFLTNTTK